MAATARKKLYRHPRVVFHCPEEIVTALSALAREDCRSRSAKIVSILRDYCRKQGALPAKEPKRP